MKKKVKVTMHKWKESCNSRPTWDFGAFPHSVIYGKASKKFISVPVSYWKSYVEAREKFEVLHAGLVLEATNKKI